MKVNIEIDMTPEEARQMMGLPDVRPLQERMLAEMEARMKAAMDTSDPEAMMKAWGIQSFGEIQRFLWDSALKAASGKSEPSKPASKSTR